MRRVAWIVMGVVPCFVACERQDAVGVDLLPSRKRELYNWHRRSKVFGKTL